MINIYTLNYSKSSG